MSLLTKLFSERYLKKLVGRTDIEDALKRLDKLTQEEVRMASAQVLKVTHTVDDRVKAVDDKVSAVIDGAQYISINHEKFVQPIARRWKRGKGGHATNSH